VLGNRGNVTFDLGVFYSRAIHPRAKTPRLQGAKNKNTPCVFLQNGPATTANLARAEGMKPQSMGATVAALDENGYGRAQAASDRWPPGEVDLTATGADVRKSAGDAKRTWLAPAIVGLDEQEPETLFAAGQIIKRLVDIAQIVTSLISPMAPNRKEKTK